MSNSGGKGLKHYFTVGSLSCGYESSKVDPPLGEVKIGDKLAVMMSHGITRKLVVMSKSHARFARCYTSNSGSVSSFFGGQDGFSLNTTNSR